MTDSGLRRLRQLVAERYDLLRTQVANRLGSASHLADDALHEAYLRMAVRDDLDQVRHPQAYLVNSAINTTINWIRGDARHVGIDTLADASEVDGLFQLPYDGPGPDRQAMDRDTMAHMLDVLDTLPPRQRALLVDHRVHDIGTAELARRWGISQVLVRREIRAAHQACLAAMQMRESGAAEPPEPQKRSRR